MKRWIPFIVFPFLAACASTYGRSKQVHALSAGISKTAALQTVRTFAEEAPGLCQATGGGNHVKAFSFAKLTSFDGSILRYRALIPDENLGTTTNPGGYVNVTVYSPSVISVEWFNFEINLTQLAAIRVMRQVEETMRGCESAGPNAYIVMIYVKENETKISNIQGVSIALESDRLDEVDKLIAALTVLSPSVKLVQGMGFF